MTYSVTPTIPIVKSVPITQAAYQFFSDYPEDISTALGTQDTSYPLDVSLGDFNGQLRVRVQFTSASSGGGLDDYQLQWDKNASDTWTDVTVGGSTVAGYDSVYTPPGGLISGGKRLTGGTGTYDPGALSETGVVNNLPVLGNNHTEVLYVLSVKSADVTNGDVITFRVLRNASALGFTAYTQTPTISIVKVPVAVTQRAYRFFRRRRVV